MKKKLTKEQKRQQANNFRKNHPVEIHLNYYPSQMQSERINKFISDDESLIPFHEAAHMVYAKACLPRFDWTYNKRPDGRWAFDMNQKYWQVTTNDLDEGDLVGVFMMLAAGYAGELAELGILPRRDSKGNFDPEFVECINRLYGSALNTYKVIKQVSKVYEVKSKVGDDIHLIEMLKICGKSDSEIIEKMTFITGMIVDMLLNDEGTNLRWKKEVANFMKISKAA